MGECLHREIVSVDMVTDKVIDIMNRVRDIKEPGWRDQVELPPTKPLALAKHPG